MKRVICAKDMEEIIKKGEKVFFINENYILTPSAKDIAKANEIEFKEEVSKAETLTSESFDSQKLLGLFKQMMQEGLLQELVKALSNSSNMKFQADSDESGFKVVRGDTIKMDKFDTGNPDAKAYYQELVSKEESKMSAGILVIEDSKFEWNLTYEEIDYVIEGTLSIEINGKSYEAYPGDIVFVPSGSKVVWGSPNKVKVFYSTYPANWAELL